MISFFIALLACAFSIGSEPITEAQYDVCDIYGKIYVVKTPGFAHFRVHEENSEAFADIIVFDEENSLYADRVGHWSFVEKRDFADVYVYFESDRNLADFSIYFTEYESFAGCNK